MQDRPSSAFGLSRFGETVHQSLLWIVVYFIGYLKVDLLWAVLMLAAYFSLQIYLFKKVSEKKKSHGRFFAKDQVFSQDLPEWVTRPDFQRTEWINTVVAQLWPYAETFVKKLLKKIEDDSSLHEKLARYHVTSIRFPHVSLGTVPPRIGGIKFLEASHRDEAILDVSVQYAGDLNIALEVGILSEKLPRAKASISNVTMTSTQLRVHMRPLLDTIPFVGSIAISFLDTPAVDFDLGGLADVLDVPLLSLLLRQIVQDQIEQSMVMPNSCDVELVPEDYLDGIIKDMDSKRGEAVTMPEGVLSIHIIEARDLVNKDRLSFALNDKSDPYALVTLQADHTEHTFHSEVVYKSLNPVWRMLVDVPVEKSDSLQDLHVVLMDKDTNKDDFLGSCTISSQLLLTAVLSQGQNQDVWRALEGVPKGSVHLEVGWSELKVYPPEDVPLRDNCPPHSPHQGVVTIVIDSCSELEIGRTGLKLPNPKVKVEVCNIVQMTETVVGTSDPVFEHRMNFLVNDPRSDKIHVYVLDDRATSWKSDATIGTLRVSLSELLVRTNNSITYTVFDLESKRPSSAKITLSLAFRYIFRPKSSSFGSHHNLQDLTKIMAHAKRALVEEQPKEEERKPLETNFDEVDNNLENGSPEPLLLQKAPTHMENGIPTSPPKLTSTPNIAAAPRRSTLPKAKMVSTNMKKDDLVTGKIQLSLKYNRKTATLSVIVHRIRNLPLAPGMKKSHPSAYVKMRLIENIQPGRSFRVSKTKKKTAVKKANLQPVFEETFTYLLPPHELKMRRLEMTVCHDGRLISMVGRSEVLSRCIVPLDTVQTALANGEDCPTVTDWYRLPRVKADHRRSLSNLTTKVQ